MLAESVLKVTSNDIRFSSLCVQSNESTIGRYTDVCERSDIEHPVFRLSCIDNMDRLVDAQENFHRSGERVGRSNERPGVDVAFWRRGKLFRPRLMIL